MTASPAHGPDVSIIGKYQLIANLGHGGMADVYLAVVHGPVGWSKLTVIKRLRPSLAEEPEFLAMFLDEARLAARLNHPNVVQTNEVAEVDGIYFIAMEYLDGQPLNRILHRGGKQGSLPREPLLRIVADSLAGLHHAHELADYDGTPIGVVHRDASPHNIFVTYDGQTKVVDFGIAKAATRSAETRGGVLKGKIAYMAPEQARSEDVDRRADIYAMGLVMWEVLTGHRLRKGSDLEMLDKIGQGEVPRLRTVMADCSPALEAIVMRATALSRYDRYATANEMRQDILAYLESVPARSSVEEVGAFVSTLFEGKRAEMRGIIEKQLSGLRRASSEDISVRVVDARRITSDSTELPRVSMPSFGSTPSSLASTGGTTKASQPPLASTSTSPGTSSSTMPSVGERGRLRAPLLIAVIAVGAAVTVLALRKGDGAPPSGASSSASATSSTGAPPAETAAAVATIEVHLSAKPEQAKLFLDDTALPSNPYAGKFRRDDKPHTVRVEAEGHASALRSISFASDQTLEVSLDRADPAKDKPPAAQPQAPPQPHDPSNDAVPKPTARPKKPLDDDDPWNKPGQ